MRKTIITTLFLIGLTVVPICPVHSQASASFATWAEVTRHLFKFGQQIADGLTIALWSQEVFSRAATGQSTPTAPFDTLKINGMLDDLERRVEQLEPAPFSVAFAVDPSVADDPAAARTTSRQAYETLLDAEVELLEASDALIQLDPMIAQMEAAWKVFDHLSDVVKDALDSGAAFVPILSQKLAFMALDIDLSYKIRINGVKTDLERKKRLLDRAIKARAGEFVQGLTAYDARLDQERAVFAEWEEELRFRRETTELLKEEADEAQSAYREAVTAVEVAERVERGIEQEIQWSRSRLSSLNTRLATLRTARSNALNAAGQPYRDCPEGYPYQSCNHHAQKRAYRQRIERHRQRARELAQQIQSAEQDRASEQARLEDLQRNLSQAQSDRQYAEQLKAAAQQRMDDAQTAYAEYFAQSLRWYWETNADVFIDEIDREKTALAVQIEKWRGYAND